MSAPLWSFADLVDAVRGRPTGTSAPAVGGISIDSRTVQPGDAFFAIKGDRFDGHDFVGAAVAHGASVAVVAQERLAGMGRITVPLVVVSDVLAALEALAVASRARSRAKIVGVTGSVGKTSTKEMLGRALAASGETHFSPASFNNHWGVPLTLARMPASARFGVFEIGMNHGGEITPLTRMVRPHSAIVTTIEPVHLEHFPDGIDGIVRAKAEIFLGVEPGGAALLNRDNPHYEALALLAIEAGVERVLSFGETADADARLDRVTLDAERSAVEATILGHRVVFRLGAPGRHLVQNALAVLLAVADLGGDLEAATAALVAMRAGKGRGERSTLSVGAAEATLIDESYNANPASMRAAIALLAQTEPVGAGRRIAVLGDMLELGPEATALHAALAGPLAAAGIDRVYLAGPLMAALWEALPEGRRGHYAESASALEPILSAEIAPGDVVMVKGSNGSRMGPLVEALKSRFAFPDQAAPSRPTGIS